MGAQALSPIRKPENKRKTQHKRKTQKQNRNTKYGKSKQKWGVLPVGAKALSPVKKSFNSRGRAAKHTLFTNALESGEQCALAHVHT